ncbi:hypothetical protein TVAG_416970 [Trichomonas vaginalis G3]|uniref:RNA polymerase I specific transcription initiation factor RRN3 family protein n=1 Tax=Trichomonas vaginalis (strain ATCC PRA-98 / G3) TaxID=412133 RepID=A2ESF5_TRIV3|nr:RNA polymerase I-specific transcription initiation factor family [Trichomonas vaginalis G3]EAY04399.1 hypothetical protein TVAG_416970 [Trichomonas vaginalis G3]KAI5526344.1 RNA polymerase I-specific transcription initiation factor family [Trichomonas vaginalis G3]|eukprot:XP_001316622.1 hypothetical protein [Trichomonas vaginalis G3]
MKGSVLQRLLTKQKQEKFGSAVNNDKWDELVPNIISGVSKFEDVIVPIQERGKVMNLFQYVTILEPSQPHLGLITRILSIIPNENMQEAAGHLREMALTYGSSASPIIDLIVRNFLNQSELFLADIINSLMDASQNFVPLIAASITKYFPQTTFEGDQQINFLRSTLHVCSYSYDVTLKVLGRVVQHIVGLDCELMIRTYKGTDAIVIDEDVAALLTPQILFLLDFIENASQNIFTLLLQLFDVYILDLPYSSVVQFIYFMASSFSSENYQTFVGFLLAKIFNENVNKRTRGNAAFYASTLVARAKYIDDQFATFVLDYVSNFAECYLNHIKQNSPQFLTRNIQVHAVYYYALQCFAYIYCWRHDGFEKMEIDVESRWKVSLLFNNELEGLSAIDPNTAVMFSNFGLIDYEPDQSVIERIQVWFPYDPCPLEEIAERVSSYYMQWGENAEPGDVDAALENSLSRICAMRGISLGDILGQ